MKDLIPSLPSDPDPIDERFSLDPLADTFTEEVLLQNTRDLVALHRAEIDEWNKAQLEAKMKGTKVAGSSVKKARKSRLSDEEKRLVELTKGKGEGSIEELF